MKNLILLVMVLLLFGCIAQQPPTEVPGENTTQDMGGNAQPSLVAYPGDTVKVSYVGTLDDGSVFDQSETPLEFTVGAGQVIKGFDDAVIGMQVGDKKSVRIEAADAYGEYDPSLVMSFNRSAVPEYVTVGYIVTTQNGMQGTVIQTNSTHVLIDFNNELAGKALNFDITMEEIIRD